jgi:hypothetical protein
MKWYSVTKYKPSIICVDCIVRSKGGSLHLANNVEMTGGGCDWISFNDEELKDVTHFMIPGPIEIEE